MFASYAGGESGARRAAREGAAIVVVDVFRASTTIAVLVSMGARVIPVASIETAVRTSAYYRIGERGSAKVAGFDFGNSPTEISLAKIPEGATVALSTTNGTRVINAAVEGGASAVFAGAFVNASAIANELCNSIYGERVVIVGCGWEGRRASEDEAAAGSILSRLARKGARLDGRGQQVAELYRSHQKARLKRNSAARRLKRLRYDADLDFCLAEDTVPVAPRLVDNAFEGG